MKEFNYKRAWREAADPALRALPAEAMRMLETLAARVADRKQDSTLAIPMHEGDRELLAPFATGQLARIARIVHDWGHWHSGRSETDATSWKSRMLQTGAHWKIANVLDQVLAERCGLPSKFQSGGKGVSFRIVGGVIRARVSGGSERRNTDFWTWEEITFASEEAVTRMVNGSRPKVSAVPDRDCEAARAWFAGLLLAERALLDESDPATLLLGAGERYSEEKVSCLRCGYTSGKTWAERGYSSLGTFFAEELCSKGHCIDGAVLHKGCCTCELAGLSDEDLRATLLEIATGQVRAKVDGMSREEMEIAARNNLRML